WAKVAGTPAEIGVTVPVVAAIRQDDATGVTTDGRTIHVTIDPDDPLDAERTDALIDEIRAVGWDGDLTLTVNDRHGPIAMGLSVTFPSSADGPARHPTS